MPGLIVTVGGKLDKSYEAALAQAALMAQKQQRQMQLAATMAPQQLDIVNRALKNLPAESLLRPRLEAMKATLTAAVGTAGAAAGQSFISRMMGAIAGHEGKMGMMQLIHTLRASFDAVVAGVNPMRVIAYEAPQALQAITLMGGTALKMLASVAAVAGSLVAIIAAPFIYLWRVNKIAESLSKFRLPDLNTEYIARLDRAAESWRGIRNAIRDTVREWNGAIATARRENEVLQAKLGLQRELDEIAKERRIQAAMGNQQQIAAIEKEYEALKIRREADRLDAEKAAKEKERAALEKEIFEKRKQINAIGVGSDYKYQRTMNDLKNQYDEALKFIRENQEGKGFWSQVGQGIRQTMLSGSWNPFVGIDRFKELQKAEADALRSDLERAQGIVREYIKLTNLEAERTAKVAERNKLQSEAEKSGERYAQLTKEIEMADAEKKRILGNMSILQKARSGQIDQNAILAGGAISQDLTANQRIGAFAYNPNVTLVNLTRDIVKNTSETNQKLQTLVERNLTPDINGPFNA